MFRLRPDPVPPPPDAPEVLRRLAQQKVQAALDRLGAEDQSAAHAEPADNSHPDSDPMVQNHVGHEDHSATHPEPPGSSHSDSDPLLQQALERMHMYLDRLEAVDRWGRSLTRAQLARVVLGPQPPADLVPEGGAQESDVFRPGWMPDGALLRETEDRASEAEERLVAALERRYPDLPASSTSWAPHVTQSLGWPEDDEGHRR